MKQYDSYKDSGVEWIGKIPSHWEKLRIKYMLTRSAAGVWGNDEQNDENDIVCFRAADFDYPHGKLREDKITIRNVPLSQLNGRTMSVGDLLIEKSGGGDNAPVGRVVRFTYNGKATCSNFIHSISTGDGLNSNFLYYYFHAMYSNKVNLLYFNQTTGLQNLQIGDYLAQSIFTPKPVEQECIASYLDKVTARIDSIIEAREKKIKLLEELRNAIISKAVTKGIDSNVETKDSGIEWIGQIPKHWLDCRFKNVADLITEPSNSSNKIGLEHIESETGKYIEIDVEYEGNGVAFKPNDIVYGKLRPYLKKVWLAEFEGNAVGDFFIYRCHDNCLPDFLHNYMLSDGFTSVCNGATFGAKMPRVPSGFISSMKFFLPPVEEQKEIVLFLKNKISEINSNIAKSRSEIDLLKEYRSSLITEVVTGKRKVV